MEGQSVEELLAKAEQEEAEKLRRITVHKELELEFDLGHLLASDRNPPTLLRQAGPSPEAELRALARDSTQLLIYRLWQLPTERVQEAVVARLPEPATRLPREKPLPRPRPLTRWQQFARLKGIRPKKKTSLVWDEVSGQWRRRWGYRRARDDTKEWLIEVPGGADPMEDQFAKRIQAKKERVAKNELNRLRNLAGAHKAQVPSAAGLHPMGHQSKEELGRAMEVAKVSTASVGRFQERLPKEKAPRGTRKKRKFQPLFGDFAAEKKHQLELLRVMNSKKPQLDVTRATNKQMREEDQEEAAKRRKMGQKGKRKGGRQGPSAGPGRGKEERGKEERRPGRKEEKEEKRKGGLGGKKHSLPPAFFRRQEERGAAPRWEEEEVGVPLQTCSAKRGLSELSVKLCAPQAGTGGGRCAH